MVVTSVDVARRAGVSRSTVSYILNGQGHRFSPETRALVESAVAELNYIPHSAGRTLVRGHSDIVLLIAPLAANADFARLVDVLTARLYEHGMTLLMRSATSATQSFATVISAVQPRAVVSLAALSHAEENILAKAEVRTFDAARFMSQVGGLNDSVGSSQVDHFRERGFETIRFVRLGPARRNLLQDARERGVQAGCARAGVTLGKPITLDEWGEMPVEQAREIATGTGLACYNDDTAVAVLDAAKEAGRNVPGELGIIGVDNSVAAARSSPHLSTVAFDFEKVYELALNVILESKPLTPHDVVIDTFVVQGGTT